MTPTAVFHLLKQTHLKAATSGLAQTREQILLYLLLVFSVVGLIAYLPSAAAAWINGLWDILLLDTLFYLALLFLLIHPNLSYKQRSFGLVLALWVLGEFLLFRLGASGAGYFWLGLATLMAVLLIGPQIALLFWLFNLLSAPVIAKLHQTIQFSPNDDPLFYWAVMSSNFQLTTLLAIIAAYLLIHGLDQAFQKQQQQAEQINKTQQMAIETLSNLAEYRDAETGHHIKRTQHYVRLLATYLSQQENPPQELSAEKIDLMFLSAPLHDIGKVGIPDSILLKPGPLSEAEMAIMRDHPRIGRDALLRSKHSETEQSFFETAAEIAYTHHEKWNGSGYPEGLKAEAIPLSGRIMAVADVYDALVNRRCYKAAMSHQAAMDYFKSQSGIHFDPALVDALIDLEHPFIEIAERYQDEK